MAYLFGCSFEHQIPVASLILGGGGATSGLVNRKVFDSLNGTNMSLETTTVPPGSAACLNLTSSIVAAANIQRAFSDDHFCFGFWFRKVGSTNPSAVTPRVVGTNASNHVIRLSSGGVLQIAAANANAQTLITPTADTWYWITALVDTSTGTHTLDAQAYDINGNLVGTATQSPATLAAVAQTNFILGTGGSIGGANVLVGCPILDDDHTKYPLMPHGSAVLVPTATGTHSFTAGNFVDDAAANLATNETTSWAKVDEIPANTTDYVQQNVDNSSGYLEYDFATTPTNRQLGSVSFVQLIGVHRPTTTGANLVGQKLNDSGTISAEATIDVSTTATTLEYLMHGYQTRPNGGGAWTTTDADALKARFGYMTLQPAQAGLSAFYIEVFAPLTLSIPDLAVARTRT